MVVPGMGAATWREIILKRILNLLITMTFALPVLAGDAAEVFPRSGIEFGLPSYLGLDSFGPEELDGFDVSWTRRTSDTRGWRIGTSLTFRDDDGRETGESPGSTYVQFRDEENDQSSLNIALQAQKLFLTEPRHGMSAILGVGPGIGYSHTRSLYDVRSTYVPLEPGNGAPEDTRLVRESETHAYWAGLVWDLGVEWRISHQVSLGARYQWSLTYRMEEEDFSAIRTGGNSSTQQGHEEGDTFTLTKGRSVSLVATFWY